MKKLLYILTAAALAMTAAISCVKYDDSELRGKISDLEDRVEQLEWQMTVANSNIEGLKSRDPAEAISSDFKTYSEKNMKIGIGQCEVTTLKDMNVYCGIYLETLNDVTKKNGLDWALLMITDVISEHSILLSTACKAEKQLPYSVTDEHVYDMPGVMSRKKQLLPEIINAL